MLYRIEQFEDQPPKPQVKIENEMSKERSFQLTVPIHTILFLTRQLINTRPQPHKKLQILQRLNTNLPVVLVLTIIFVTVSHDIVSLAKMHVFHLFDFLLVPGDLQGPVNALPKAVHGNSVRCLCWRGT